MISLTRCSRQLSSAKMTYVIYILLINLHNIFNNGVGASTHSVSTYKRASLLSSLQLVTSSTLDWEPYKVSLESKPKQLEFAIQGSIFKTEEEHYPIFICRVNMEGISRSGYTSKRGQKHVCMISYMNQLKPYKQFDILVNKGKLAKVSWIKWKRYEEPPNGAVSVNHYTFVARRKTKEGHHDGSEYEMGRLEVTENNNGKIYVTDAENNEHHYLDGEVLVEVEPYKYELSDIQMDKIRMDVKINTTELASTILSNTEESEGAIKSLMTYSYDLVDYWGNQEGLVRALPTKIFEYGMNKPLDIKWALKNSIKQEATKEISSLLYPGTAINVTLVGNITTLEAPYTARLMTYFQDIEKMSTKISATVYKKFLSGVRLEFSPAYWIENGTLIPTTTTTTTTTTESVKQVTKDANPMLSPPTVTMTDVSTSPKTEETNEVIDEEVTKHDYAANLAQANILGSATGSASFTSFSVATVSFALIVLSSTYLNC